MINFIQFTLTRAGLAIITLLLVCFIVFSLMELVPGTCAERYLAFKNTQGSQITYEEIEKEKFFPIEKLLISALPFVKIPNVNLFDRLFMQSTRPSYSLRS